MDEYIFYGMVHSRTLRDMAEGHVESLGGHVVCYCDDAASGASREAGTMPVPVASSGVVFEHPDATVAILSSSVQKMAAKLRREGARNRIVAAPLLGYRFVCEPYCPPREMEERSLSWIRCHEGELRRIYAGDDASTAYLLDEILRERGPFQWVPLERLSGIGNDEAYFRDPALRPEGDITFVDGGSYGGDTIRDLWELYGDRMRRVYAFEPERQSILRLERTVAELGGGAMAERVTVIRQGLHSARGSLRFSLVGDMLAQDDQGDIAVPVTRLDDALQDVAGTLCIKMDLEGSEIPALLGAAETIRKHRPCLVVCLYHRMEDLLEVPKTISGILPDYDFYLRGGFHTECYAVPRQ